MKHAVMLVGSADQSIIVTLIVPSFSPFENVSIEKVISSLQK